MDTLRKNITRTTADFVPADGEEMPKVKDQERAIIGGMIIGKTVKTTRTNNLMAFITIEDLYGTVEVIVFPRDYEKYRTVLEEDRKVFIQGRITVEEDKPAKLICSGVIPFDELEKELWIQCRNRQDYAEKEEWLFQILGQYDGRDGVNIYLSEARAKKRLPNSRCTHVCPELLATLFGKFGEDNVKVTEKSIEKNF